MADGGEIETNSGGDAVIIKRKDKEVDDVLSKCDELEDSGENHWPGETYSAGVKNAIMWLTGQYGDNPMSE